MTHDTLLALIGLAAISSWTPGPNNALLASSGANFGLRRTLPHILGITVGYPLMITLIGVGLGSFFQQHELFRQIVGYIGSMILLWIAWQLARAPKNPAGGARKLHPFTFLGAASFQWVNPKSWAVGIAITSQWIQPDNVQGSLSIIACVLIAVSFFSALTWAVFGSSMHKWLSTSTRLLRFNRAMAGLIVLFAIYLLVE